MLNICFKPIIALLSRYFISFEGILKPINSIHSLSTCAQHEKDNVKKSQ